MGKVLPQFKGRAEGSTINAIAREELAGRGDDTGRTVGRSPDPMVADGGSPDERARPRHSRVSAPAGARRRARRVGARARRACARSRRRADLAWLEAEHRRVGRGALAARRRAGLVARAGARAGGADPPAARDRQRVDGAGAAGRRASCCARRAARATRCATTGVPPSCAPCSAPFADRMVVAKAQEEAIERAIGEDGVVQATTRRRRCAASGASCARRTASWFASSSA